MDNCPDCLRKDTAKEFADRDHKAEVERLTSRASTAETRAQAAEARAIAAEEAAKKNTEIPDLDAVIQHCTTCPSHKTQLDAFKESVRREYVDKISPEAVKELAKVKGVDLSPDTIKISGFERKSRT